MIGYGIPEADICLLIKNPETGKPIDLKTLRRHFAREIATGVTKLKSLAGNRIVAAMVGRDGGVTDELTQAKLLMLFAETSDGLERNRGRRARKRGSPPVHHQGQQNRRQTLTASAFA